MMLQGTQLHVLQTIDDIEQVTSVAEVEDLEIADEIDMDIRLVRNALDVLAKAGYIYLEKIKTFSGVAYSAFLTSQGKATLAESRSLISEK